MSAVATQVVVVVLIFMAAGIVVLFFGSCRYFFAGRMRNITQRRAAEETAQGGCVSSQEQSSFTPSTPLPSVAFVMPVKWEAMRTANPIATWRSQVLTGYTGPHESIFVVESDDDGAVEVVKSLQAELVGSAIIRLVVAGSSTSCTQKIHNMIAGVDACGTHVKYVLFMDANGLMHRNSVAVLLKELESNPNILASTGYPLDVPAPGASIWAWTICQFRHFCLTEFQSNRSDFIWGGAMLMRKIDIDENTCEVKSRWLQGGYSDDMLVAACAADGGMVIATPLQALFPNELRSDITFSQAWNFLRRQVFVLTTYGSRRNCLKHALLLVTYAMGNILPILSFPATVVAWVCVLLTPAASWQVVCITATLTCLHVAVVLLVLFAQKWHLQASAKLTAVLSPETPMINTAHARYATLFVSFLLQSTMAFFVITASICCRSITWGSITYSVRWGKVVGIIPNGQSASSQEPTQLSLQQQRRQLLLSLRSH